MKGPRRSGPAPTDPNGAQPAWRPARRYLVLAVALLAGALAYALLSAPAPAPIVGAQAPIPESMSPMPPSAPKPATAPAAPAAPVAAASGTNVLPAPSRIPRVRDPDGDQTPDIADFVNPGETPTMGEVIDRLHQAGVHSGLGAFSPPGTRPPLVGLAVPEDFPLPDGYVRHYQATDDGQRIEPILMFAPDRPLVDAANRPITIPKDRVVPPELAPPGLPIRRIVIPAPTEPGRPGR